MDVFGIILPIVYILAGCALVWFIIELALAVRKLRATVTELKEQVDPAIANVNKITQQLPPIVDKVDPLMDRVTLTVDSVNLELMRVDEVLEDVSQITGTVSKATNAVDTVTSAPLDIVTNVTSKVRGLFKPKYASDQTKDIGAENSDTTENPIVEFASAAATAAGDAVREQRDIRAERKQVAQEKQDAADAKNQTMRQTATTITNEVLAQAQADAPDASAATTVAPSSVPHNNPIDPSFYAVEVEAMDTTDMVLESIDEATAGDAAIEAVGEVAPDGEVVATTIEEESVPGPEAEASYTIIEEDNER